MKAKLWLVAAVCTTLLLAAPVIVPTPSHTAAAADYGRAELVGRVVSKTGKLTGRRLYVKASGVDWTIHVPDDIHIAHGRQSVSMHDINKGMYVHVRGEQIGQRRIKASRVDVIGDRLALTHSRFWRAARTDGFYSTTAGYRGSYRRSYRR
jgi:hypothetical protein